MSDMIIDTGTIGNVQCGRCGLLYALGDRHICSDQQSSNPLQLPKEGEEGSSILVLYEQVEKIVWHKYPEVKPPKEGWYYADFEYWTDGDAKNINIRDDLYWDGDGWQDWNDHLIQVFAWAELPKGVKDD